MSLPIVRLFSSQWSLLGIVGDLDHSMGGNLGDGLGLACSFAVVYVLCMDPHVLEWEPVQDASKPSLLYEWVSGISLLAFGCV